jgi:hypothetical protein
MLMALAANAWGRGKTWARKQILLKTCVSKTSLLLAGMEYFCPTCRGWPLTHHRLVIHHTFFKTLEGDIRLNIFQAEQEWLWLKLVVVRSILTWQWGPLVRLRR